MSAYRTAPIVREPRTLWTKLLVLRRWLDLLPVLYASALPAAVLTAIAMHNGWTVIVALPNVVLLLVALALVRNGKYRGPRILIGLYRRIAGRRRPSAGFVRR